MKPISLLFILTLAGSQAMAQPLATSLNPRKGDQPTPQLPDSSKPGVFPMLTCLASLIQGNTVKTEEACGMALALNPQEHDAYKLRGYAYLIDHRFELAEADFRAALRLKPRDADDRAGHAQSLSGQGRFAEAVAEYRKAIAITPAKAPYWNGLCWARAGTGRDLDKALGACNRALALQPNAAGALNSRGLVRLRMGQFDRAVSDYTASLAAGPLQASARFGRGLAWLGLGQTAKGRSDIVEARRLDGEIDSLFALLGMLPAACLQLHKSCPSGFPDKPAPRNPAYLVANSGR